MNLPSPPRFPVTVGPTPTTVVSVDVRPDELVTLQIDNLDGTQTFSGTVERRLSDAAEWSPSSIGDFSSIAPAGSAGDSVTADLDVSGTGFLRLVGTMSGAGGDVAYVIRIGARKR